MKTTHLDQSARARIELFVCPKCHCSNHTGRAGIHVCWNCKSPVATVAEPNERYGLYAVLGGDDGQIHGSPLKAVAPAEIGVTK